MHLLASQQFLPLKILYEVGFCDSYMNDFDCDSVFIFFILFFFFSFFTHSSREDLL